MDSNLQEILNQQQSRGRPRGRGSSPNPVQNQPFNSSQRGMNPPINRFNNFQSQPQFHQNQQRGQGFNQPFQRSNRNMNPSGSNMNFGINQHNQVHNIGHNNHFQQNQQMGFQNQTFNINRGGNFNRNMQPNINNRFPVPNNQQGSRFNQRIQNRAQMNEQMPNTNKSPQKQRRFINNNDGFNRRNDRGQRGDNFHSNNQKSNIYNRIQSEERINNFRSNTPDNVNPRSNIKDRFQQNYRGSSPSNFRGRNNNFDGNRVNKDTNENVRQKGRQPFTRGRNQNPINQRKFQQKKPYQKKYVQKSNKKDDFINDQQGNDQDSEIMDQQSQRSLQQQIQQQQQNASGSYDSREDQQQQNQEQEQEQQEQEQSGPKFQEKKPLLSIIKPVNIKNINKSPQQSSDACHQKCLYAEYLDRIKNFQENNRDNASLATLKLDTSRTFSIFQIDKKTNKPQFKLTLKRFRRSADRAQDDQNKKDKVSQYEDKEKQKNQNYKRSVIGLIETINHINAYIVDADSMNPKYLLFPLPPNQKKFQFIHIYDFLWDRMREMIKDITRLSDQQQMTQQIIQISQQIARFFIIAINQGRGKYDSRLQFDEKMNQESLRKIITPLIGIYHASRAKLEGLIQRLKDKNQNVTFQRIEQKMKQQAIYISPYQPEITAYAVLISNDINKSIHQQLFSGFQSYFENPLFNSQQVQIALQVQKCLKNTNYQKYFQIVQDPKIDYVMSCMILHHVNKMRIKATNRMFDTMRYQVLSDKVVSSTIQINYFRNSIRLQNEQQLSLFLKATGVQYDREEKFITKTGYEQFDEYKIPMYVFQANKLQRTLYTDQKATKIIFNPQEITRSQLITRSWKQSDYIRQLISVFLGKQAQIKLPLIARKSISIRQQKKKQKQQEQKRKNQEKLKSLDQLRIMRQGIKKKNQRKTFLESFTKHLEMIYKVSIGQEHCKQKASCQFLSVLGKNLFNKKFKCFEKIVQVKNNKTIVESCYTQILNYSKKIKQFQKARISKAPSFFSNNSWLTQQKTLNHKKSQIMNVTQYSKNPITKQNIFQVIKRLFMAKLYTSNQINGFTKDKFQLNLTLFVNRQMSNEEQLIFIKVIKYITNEKMSKSLLSFCEQPDLISAGELFFIDFKENLERYEISYRLRIIKIDTQQKYLEMNLPENFDLSQQDGLIILQIQNQLSNVLEFFNKYKSRYFNKDQTIEPLRKPIIDFKLNYGKCDFKTNLQNQHTSNLNLDQCNLSISTQLYYLSTIFKVKFKNFLAKTVNCKNSIPQIKIVKGSTAIKQIKTIMTKSLNCYFQKHNNLQNTEQFVYYISFFNKWIQYILEFNQLCFKNPEMINNWRQIINQIALDSTVDDIDQNNYWKDTKQQKDFTLSVLSKLKMNFIQECRNRRLNFQKKDLLQTVIAYLNNFDSSREIKDFDDVTSNLNINLGRIYGSCQKFFSFLLLKLAKYLDFCNFIFPVNYKITINSQQLEARAKILMYDQANFQKQLNRKFQSVQQQIQKHKRSHKQLQPWIEQDANDIFLNQFGNQISQKISQNVNQCMRYRKKTNQNKRTIQNYGHERYIQMIRKMKKLNE